MISGILFVAAVIVCHYNLQSSSIGFIEDWSSLKIISIDNLESFMFKLAWKLKTNIGIMKTDAKPAVIE